MIKRLAYLVVTFAVLLLCSLSFAGEGAWTSDVLKPFLKVSGETELSGNVGIGTSDTSAAELTVDGAISATSVSAGTMALSGSPNLSFDNIGIQFTDDGSETAGILSIESTGNTNNNKMRWDMESVDGVNSWCNTDGTTAAISVDTVGNVGIGTTAPAAALSVVEYVADNSDATGVRATRIADEGTDYIEMLVDQYRVALFRSNRNLIFRSSSSIQFEPSSGVSSFGRSYNNANDRCRFAGETSTPDTYTYVQAQYSDVTDFLEWTRPDSTAQGVDFQLPVKMTGDGRFKHEYEVPITALGVGATGPDQTILGNSLGYSYDIGDDSVVSYEVSDMWDEATAYTIKLYWYINEAYATGSGEIQWRMQWSACPTNETEAIDAPTHTGTIDFGDQNIPATAKYLTSTSGTIAAASLANGDHVAITLDRVALDDGSNPTADPVIVRVEIVPTCDKLGEAI